MAGLRQRFDLTLHLVAQLVCQFQAIENDCLDWAHPDFSEWPELDFLDDVSFEDEPPEDPESFGFDELLFEFSDLDEDLSSFELESEPSLSDDFFPAPVLPYPSAYQPPPFRMKLGAESSRLTRRLLHLGQDLIGSSVMRCSRSNSSSHFWH
jgi:hypothetical protein